MRVSRWIFALSIAGGLVSCNPWTVLSQQETKTSLNQPRNVTVQAIASLAPDAAGEEIHIKGIVAQRAPFVEGGAYEVQDTTGKIWVITNAQLPETGSEILVAGQLNVHNLQLGSNDFGELYITERQLLNPNLAVQPAPPREPAAIALQEPITPVTPPTVAPVVETQAPQVQQPQPAAQPQAQPQKLNLDSYLLPHKAHRKK